MNAAALLLATGGAQREALVCGAARMRYDTLREHTRRAAAVLRARGVAPQSRVAIRLPDGIDWVVACLGAMWAGAVAVPVNPRLPAAQWPGMLAEADFALILGDVGCDTPLPWRERCLDTAAWRSALDEVEGDGPDAWPADAHAPAFWCHSSGTTGAPKAVVHGHGFAQHVAQVSQEGLGLHAGDRLLSSSKLFFVYAQVNALWAGLRLGATVVLDPQWPTAEGVAATVVRQRPSVFFSVPSMYRDLLAAGHAAAVAAAGVRLCVSAGEALPEHVRDAWRRATGLTIVSGWGASETLVMCLLDRGDGRGLVASPGAGVQPLAREEAGVPVRLCIRAPTLALGYVARPHDQAACFRDGAFCAADLFIGQGADGWRFAGREDALVKIHGRWVNLVEVEEHLAAGATGVAQGAAVHVPDADGVGGVAYFYVADDAVAARAALLAVAEGLPAYQRPRWWHAVPDLPRGPTGKLLRRQLQALHGEAT